MNYIFKSEVSGSELTLALFRYNDPNPFWKNQYPSFTICHDEGEHLTEDPTLIEQGIMKNRYDVAGLRKHLVSVGVLLPEDQIN